LPRERDLGCTNFTRSGLVSGVRERAACGSRIPTGPGGRSGAMDRGRPCPRSHADGPSRFAREPAAGSKSIAKFIAKLDGGGRLQKTRTWFYRDVGISETNRGSTSLPRGLALAAFPAAPLWAGAEASSRTLVALAAAGLYALEFAQARVRPERHGQARRSFNIALSRLQPRTRNSGRPSTLPPSPQVTNGDGRDVGSRSAHATY